MFKFIITTLLSVMSAVAFAAVDVNKASQAELEAIKGVGPAVSTRILDERQKSTFKDWADMVERVKGVGTGNAAKFSAAGLTVNGASFDTSATAAPKKATRQAPVAKP